VQEDTQAPPAAAPEAAAGVPLEVEQAKGAVTTSTVFITVCAEDETHLPPKMDDTQTGPEQSEPCSISSHTRSLPMLPPRQARPAALTPARPLTSILHMTPWTRWVHDETSVRQQQSHPCSGASLPGVYV